MSMNDNGKTKQQLIKELATMRRRVSQLEESEAGCQHREDALRESEKLQNAILNNVGAYIYLKDTQYRYTYVNNKVCRLFGFKENEIIGKDDSSFFSAASVREIMESDRRVIEQGETVTREETDLTSSDNLPRTYWAVKLPIKDSSGNINGLCGISTDITGLKRTEEELRRLNHVQSLILDNSIRGIAFVRHRIFEWVNSRLSNMLGLPLDRVQGFSVRLLYASDKDYEDQEREIYPALSRGEWFESKLAVHRPDGNAFTGWIIGKALNPSAPNEGSIWILEDITDRKRMEENLRESEAKYRLLVDNSYDLIWTLNADGVFTYVSPSWKRILGYEPSYMIGKSFQPLVHPDDVDLCNKFLLQTIQLRKQIPGLRYRVLRADGAWRWHEASGTPVFGPDGSFVSFVGVSRDVNDRRQMEESLKRSESQLSSIIEFLPDATFVIDLDGKVIAWNLAIEQMTGVSKENMLGQGDHAYMIPFYGERRRHVMDLIDASDPDLESLYRYVQRKGNTLYAEAYTKSMCGGKGAHLFVTAAPLFDNLGNRVGAIESIRDITDRRKAEEKYRGIFENAVMGIFQATPDGHIISANPAFARILGYDSPEEVVREVTDMIRQVYAAPRQHADLMHVMDEQGRILGQEIQLLKKDANAVFVYASGRAVRDGTGKFLYYEGTIQDITDRRRLESQLRQAQKMEAIGTLAGGVAHDFNNILASMMGFTEMAAKETRQDVRRKYHDRVLQACERAKNLVNQILAFSRRREQESSPLDIKLILAEALSLLRATLPATILIKQQITHEETYVLADPTQIHQIIMNLCTNAAHAMREKGGLLDIHLSEIEILHPEQSSHPDLPAGSYVQLSVRDTGHGIDAAIQDKIFDPFFTTKKAKEGTGLGLSVVYGIAKSCGGAIDVQSTVGQGATFTIYLPRIHPASHTEETIRVEVDLQGNERILFVDDEEALVSMAQAFFESLGYSITATVSSAEAFRLFRKKPDQFDLVITDMTMPEMTGAELARALLKIRPDLPVILCTGYSDAINKVEVKKLNIREFILKPVSLHDLGLRVRRVLKGETYYG